MISSDTLLYNEGITKGASKGVNHFGILSANHRNISFLKPPLTEGIAFETNKSSTVENR